MKCNATKIVISHSYKCTAYSKFPMHFPFYHILSLDESFRRNKAAKRSEEMKQSTKETEHTTTKTGAISLPLLVDSFVCFVLSSPSSSCTSYLFFSKFFSNVSFGSGHFSIYFIGSTWRFRYKVESLQ